MSNPAPQPERIVAAMSEEFRARSTEIEQQRRLPMDLAQSMATAGLFRMLVPEVYGGSQSSPQVFFDTLAAAAKADSAVGWCLMIGNTTGLLSASLSTEWAEKIYGSNPDVITVGVTAPIGKATPAQQTNQAGIQVSGRWPFGSGSQVANWICGGCTLHVDGKPELNEHGIPQPMLAFFPAEEVTIHTETWDTSGLRGTGSHDISVQDQFVPEGRWVALGKRARIDAPLYRFPTFGLLALGVSAVSLGIGERALEEFIKLADAKTPTGATRTLAHRSSAQKELAQASAHLSSARAMTREFIEEAWQQSLQDGRLGLDVKAKLRQAATNNAWSAVAAVDLLYHAAGGSAIYSKSKLQQCFRDVHVTTQHIMVGQATYEVIGKVQMGVDPRQPL